MMLIRNRHNLLSFGKVYFIFYESCIFFFLLNSSIEDKINFPCFLWNFDIMNDRREKLIVYVITVPRERAHRNMMIFLPTWFSNLHAPFTRKDKVRHVRWMVHYCRLIQSSWGIYHSFEASDSLNWHCIVKDLRSRGQCFTVIQYPCLLTEFSLSVHHMNLLNGSKDKVEKIVSPFRPWF